MIIKLSKRAALVAGAAAAAAPSASALQCGESEALLRVSYSIDKNGWGNLYGDDDSGWNPEPVLKLRPSGNVGNSTEMDYVEYLAFEDVVDYEVCIPRKGACLELTVSVFPVDAYDIMWDGEAVEVGREFTWYSGEVITSTEIGEFCTPVCDEDAKALFDFQFWTSSMGHVNVHRVEGPGGDMILGCNAAYEDCYWRSYSLYKHRECLPKGKCYQFLIGDDYQWIPDTRGTSYGGSFSLHYDGELVGESDSWLFESMAFGEDCLPHCDPDSQSTVEFFMYRVTSFSEFCEPPLDSTRTDLDYSFELSLMSNGGSTLATSGVVPHCSNTSLHHEAICVPKESCTEFRMKSFNNTYTGTSVYSLEMDGISYRKDNYRADVQDQTTNLGSCTVEALCNPSNNEALFEVDLLTPKEYAPDGMPLPAIYPSDIDWLFGKRFSEGYYPDSGIRSYKYNDVAYDLGSVYRTIECVPDAECEYDFNITSDSPVESYVVKRNGMELSETYEAEVVMYYSPGEVTQFGENCNTKKKLSGGAIAGIVIACVVAVAAAVFGFMWYKKQKTSSEEGGTERDTLDGDTLEEGLLSSTL